LVAGAAGKAVVLLSCMLHEEIRKYILTLRKAFENHDELAKI